MKLSNANKMQRIAEAKVSILAAHTIDRARRLAAEQGEKPRIDELEMASQFGAKIYDFEYFEQSARKDWLTRLHLGIAKLTGMWSTLWVLRVFSLTKKDDVVYATWDLEGLQLAALLRLARRKKPHIILRVDSPTWGRTPLRRLIYNFLFRFAVKRIDTILCRTKGHRNQILDSFGGQPDSIIVIPETIDSVYFSRLHPIEAKDAIVVPDSPYLFSAGLEMRDYETLITAVKDMPVQVIISPDSPWSTCTFDVAEQTLPDNVTVQFYSPRQLRALYRSASLTVLPIHPTSRPCGITVVLEAWAMCCPVIASGTVGLNQCIQNGKTGRLVTPRNVPELRSAIFDLLAQPTAAQRLAQNGHQRVIDELNLEEYLERVGTIIAGLLVQ